MFVAIESMVDLFGIVPLPCIYCDVVCKILALTLIFWDFQL